MINLPKLDKITIPFLIFVSLLLQKRFYYKTEQGIILTEKVQKGHLLFETNFHSFNRSGTLGVLALNDKAAEKHLFKAMKKFIEIQDINKAYKEIWNYRIYLKHK